MYQAVFCTDDNQWGRVDKSVKDELEKQPDLVRYISAFRSNDLVLAATTNYRDRDLIEDPNGCVVT